MSPNNHLEKFRECSEEEHKWVGLNILDWWESVFPGEATSLPPKAVTRGELKALCADPSFSDQETLAAVMAWGGMRRNHGRELHPNLGKICKVVGTLRSGKLSRQEAFSEFLKHRLNGNLRGMSAAYFTKLIFFCSPQHDGYIMDQWTSKSVNLIKNEKLVHLTYAGHVSDKNDASTYCQFCEFIEDLSQEQGWTPEETEVRLFSYGGKNKGKWRAHVVQNWHR